MPDKWEQYAEPAAKDSWDQYAEPQQTSKPATGEGTFLHPQRSASGDVLLTSYPTAIRSGLESIGSGISGAVKGVYDTFRHPVDTAKGVMSLPGQAAQIPAAVHDINQSPDPLGTYAKAGQEIAGQGAGQALTAIAAPYVVKGVGSALPAGVRLAARSAEAAVNQKLVPVRPILNLGTPADAAEAVKVKIPGRDFGLKPVETPPEVISPSRTIGGSAGKDIIAPPVRTPAQPIPPRSGLALPPAQFDIKGVEPALEQATGATRLKPDVPLKDQLTSKPEHLGQFARANGLELDKALNAADKAKVHGLTNVQVRQLAINLGEDMGQDVVGRAKASGAVPRSEIFGRLLKDHSPSDIVKAIDEGKHLPEAK